MNYEKSYKEALERAKIAYKDEDRHLKATLERIFPALKESEDEKIRKDIVIVIEKEATRILKETGNMPIWYDGAISWLEKQGEQKPIEQDTETYDLWVYIREWNDKFGRLPKDEDELASCIDYVMKRQKLADKVEPKFHEGEWITIKE